MIRLDGKNLVTLAVLTFAALGVAAAGTLHWLRAAAERDADALAEYAAEQELLVADLAPSSPLGEVRQTIRLHREPGVTETLELLHALAEQQGVVLTTCRPTATNERGRVTFAASGHAAGTSLCRFFAQIERHARCFAIGPTRLRAAEPDRVGFEVTVTAFHQEGGR